MGVHELASDHTVARVDLDVGATITDLDVDERAVLWRQPPLADPGPDDDPEPSMMTWMHRGVGGWEVMAPNAGDAATTPDGTVHPFHGTAGRSAWTLESVKGDTLAATLDLPDHAVSLRRTIAVAGRTCRVDEQLDHVGDRPVSTVWGSHLALGQDMLRGSLQIEVDGDVLAADVNGQQVAPDGFRTFLGAPVDGQQALGFVAAAAEVGQARLVSDAGVASVSWNATTFPYLWVWVELEASDWPWQRRARAVGLEPVSSWPATGVDGVRTSTGTQVDLAPGDRHTGWIELTVEPHA